MQNQLLCMPLPLASLKCTRAYSRRFLLKLVYADESLSHFIIHFRFVFRFRLVIWHRFAPQSSVLKKDKDVSLPVPRRHEGRPDDAGTRPIYHSLLSYCPLVTFELGGNANIVTSLGHILFRILIPNSWSFRPRIRLSRLSGPGPRRVPPLVCRPRPCRTPSAPTPHLSTLVSFYQQFISSAGKPKRNSSSLNFKGILLPCGNICFAIHNLWQVYSWNFFLISGGHFDWTGNSAAHRQKHLQSKQPPVICIQIRRLIRC